MDKLLLYKNQDGFPECSGSVLDKDFVDEISSNVLVNKQIADNVALYDTVNFNSSDGKFYKTNNYILPDGIVESISDGLAHIRRYGKMDYEGCFAGEVYYRNPLIDGAISTKPSNNIVGNCYSDGKLFVDIRQVELSLFTPSPPPVSLPNSYDFENLAWVESNPTYYSFEDIDE